MLPSVQSNHLISTSCLPVYDWHRPLIASPIPIKLKCFGLNDYGQLGLGDKVDRGGSASTMGDGLAAVDFGTGAPPVVAMSAGGGHTCVIFSGGSLKV